MSGKQSAYNQGSKDGAAGKGMANTKGMTSTERESYVSGHKNGSKK